MDNFAQLMQIVSQLGGTESTDNPQLPNADPGMQQQQQMPPQMQQGPNQSGPGQDAPTAVEEQILEAVLTGGQVQVAGQTLDFSFIPPEITQAFQEILSNSGQEPQDEEAENPEEEAAESPEEEDAETAQEPPAPTQTAPMTGPGESPPPETTGPVELHAAPFTVNKSKEQDRNAKSDTKKKVPPKK